MINYPIFVLTVVNAGWPKLENIEFAGFPNVVPNPIGLLTFDEKNDWLAGGLFSVVFNPEKPENAVLAFDAWVLNNDEEVVVLALNVGNAFCVLTPKA